jgi:RNA polymerase sigma factor (TIGR02999 family)
MLAPMSTVPQILATAGAGDPRAAADLLPLVYAELRRLAAARLAGEKPGQTLQPTALVHEAYVRLVGGEQSRDWDGRGHFFAAAAEAMRRILVDAARRKSRLKHGGGHERVPLDGNDAADVPPDPVDLLALSDALDRFEAEHPRRAALVKLRYFAGLTLPEVAGLLGVSQSTAEADWTYAKAWLKRALGGA